MAAGFFKRAMVYLGLVDDEYEDYEDYEPGVRVRRSALAQRGSTKRTSARPGGGDHQHHPTDVARRVDGHHVLVGQPRSTVRPVPMDAGPGARVAPVQFGDARQIADRSCQSAGDRQPAGLDRELMRRMIDSAAAWPTP